MKTYYPSFKGRWDNTVAPNERGKQWIFITAFPSPKLSNIPADDELSKIKKLYAESSSVELRDTGWGLAEQTVPRSAGKGAFYQPSDRREMIHGVPTIFCNETLASSDHGTCIGRAVVSPDIYVMFSYSQKLLPCWAQVEEGVRRVVAFNMTIPRVRR